MAGRTAREEFLHRKFSRSNRRQPSLEVLFEIAKILQVDPKDLIDSDETK